VRLLAQFDDIEAVTQILDAPGAAASGGASATGAGEFLDTLYARKNEYLERDRFASIGEVDDFYTKIVGVSFEGRQDLVAGVRAGDALELERQPENEHDPNAIAVRFGTLHLGYLRREIARRLAPNIDGGDRYTASVGSVTGGGGRHVGVNIRVLRRRAVVPAVRAEARRELESTDALRVALIGERPLREAQRAVLDRLAAGRNTLAVLGTGRGKSLCFQLPAAERALERGEKTLVFYPLRALANDQYDALDKRLRRFGLRIFRANGAIDGQERAALEAALEDGSWDIILSTPEFATYHRHAFECAWNRPHLVVVDEAHHIFDSRHRAAYGTLGALVRGLGAPQVLALTATANDEAFREIRAGLEIEAWVIDPTVRENLRVVDARNTGDKNAYLASRLAGDGKAIVYTNSRAEATKLAERLRARVDSSVAFYHAGVPSAERARVEDLFREGEVRIVVATSAFGEGIDLPDVRDVVLYHLNFNFTEFNQMAGRAGRDGDPARIHLLYGESDRNINDFIIAQGAPSITVLRELYRGMRGLASDGAVRLSHDDIARTLEIDLVRNGTTVGAGVRIFEEAGLVESGTDDDGRFVRFLGVGGKVDLTATSRYAEGIAEREAFERFCDLALTADAPTLEQIINRPIYPDRVPLVR
jgi:single-stranded-DNA-specific exonuclease